MLEIRTNVVEAGYRLTICRRKVEGLLRKRASFEPAQNWDDGLAELHPLAAGVIDELQNQRKLLRHDAGSCILSFADAAGLENSDAEAINLLPAFPFQL